MSQGYTFDIGCDVRGSNMFQVGGFLYPMKCYESIVCDAKVCVLTPNPRYCDLSCSKRITLAANPNEYKDVVWYVDQKDQKK